jgi:hypothetical protein
MRIVKWALNTETPHRAWTPGEAHGRSKYPVKENLHGTTI